MTGRADSLGGPTLRNPPPRCNLAAL